MSPVGNGSSARRARIARVARRVLARLAPRLFLRTCTATRAELGMIGETLVARSLGCRGWSVVARRLRTPHGELDLVMSRRGRWLVLEVKCARLPLSVLPREIGEFPMRPGRSLGTRQRARVLRAAAWCARDRRQGCSQPRSLSVCLAEVLVVGSTPRIAFSRLQGSGLQ